MDPERHMGCDKPNRRGQPLPTGDPENERNAVLPLALSQFSLTTERRRLLTGMTGARQKRQGSVKVLAWPLSLFRLVNGFLSVLDY